MSNGLRPCPCPCPCTQDVSGGANWGRAATPNLSPVRTKQKLKNNKQDRNQAYENQQRADTTKQMTKQPVHRGCFGGGNGNGDVDVDVDVNKQFFFPKLLISNLSIMMEASKN